MNITPMTMDREAALAKYTACINEKHADAYEFNQACAVAYAHLAKGEKLLRLSEAIQRGGLNDKGLPNIAIGRADRREVYFRWQRNETTALFSTASDWARRDPLRNPTLNTVVNMGTSFIDDNVWSREGYALVPTVPADVRPAKGLLKDWFILWEVDQWATQPRFAKASRDPYLLEHISGDLYAVIAEWDLTPIEIAIMEGAMS